MPKKKYVAAGVIAAGSAAVITAYAMRRRKNTAVDKELAGLLDEADAPPAKPSPKAEALSGARSDGRASANAAYRDVMAAKPAVAKANPAGPA